MSKNTHLEHIEDLLFNEGLQGANKAIAFMKDLRKMLSGHVDGTMNITTKWDGAPAIFAGIDPRDGKFFVAKKGVFNKDPKVYKTTDDLNELSGELKKKFAIVLQEFPKLGITKGVFQGDLMFTKGDVKIEKIKGERFYTFQPNTIIYAVPTDSHLGKIIAQSRIGIVWHTEYHGDSFETMKSSFGGNIVGRMKKPKTIWQDDATFKDISGTVTFTKKELESFDAIVEQLQKLIHSTSPKIINRIMNDDELKIRIKAFNNMFIRGGQQFPNPRKHAKDLYSHINEFYQKEIDKRKTDKGKKIQAEKLARHNKQIFAQPAQIARIYEILNHLMWLKGMIIKKLNRGSGMNTFLRTRNGFKVTEQEGFVAIDHIGNAIKIVDRLEFSKANFSPNIIKGWQR